MKSLIPFILIVADIGIFFVYIDPLYQDEIKPLQKEIADYNSVLESSTKLLAKREELIAKNNAISTEEISQLEKLLPDTIDNVRLIIDLEGIAKNHGLTLTGLSLSESSNASAEEARRAIAAPGDEAYGSITVSFGVSASYESFMLFLQDLEQSLRIMDVVNLSVTASPSGLYSYGITIKTYWLK